MGLKGREVAIAGAGVAGLAAGVAFAQRGAQVTLYEQAEALAPVGAGLQISPNGGAVLEALGVKLPGLTCAAVELRAGETGRRVARLDLTGNRYGRPFRLVHRADLIEALAGRAADLGVEIRFGQAVRPAELDAPLILGADGVKSALRPALNGAEKPFFTGQTAWRAVIADAGSEPVATVHMGPGRHLVSYPLREGRRNIVAVLERPDWVAEDWDQPDDPANLRAAFAGFAPELRGWLDQVQEVKLWGLFRHRIAKRWQDGQRVLIGDAAHPTLPFLAQGANLALEDALLLARALEVGRQKAGLARFEAARRARVARAIATANGNARNYHLRQPLLRACAHTTLRLVDRFAPGAMLAQFDWLYGFDPQKA